MLIIWRGFGWLIPVIVFASFILSQLTVDAIFGEQYYKENEWPKVTAVALSMMLIGLLGYFVNYKKRGVVVDPETGTEKKTPYHSLFFIPIEFWALILPAFFFLMDNFTAENDAREMALIETPAVNDVYGTDFTEVFTDNDATYKFGALKVVAVESDGVEVVASELAYDKKSGIRGDISNGKAYTEAYYLDEVYFMSHQVIVDMKNSDVIFQVSRVQK